MLRMACSFHEICDSRLVLLWQCSDIRHMTENTLHVAFICPMLLGSGCWWGVTFDNIRCFGQNYSSNIFYLCILLSVLWFQKSSLRKWSFRCHCTICPAVSDRLHLWLRSVSGLTQCEWVFPLREVGRPAVQHSGTFVKSSPLIQPLHLSFCLHLCVSLQTTCQTDSVGGGSHFLMTFDLLYCLCLLSDCQSGCSSSLADPCYTHKDILMTTTFCKLEVVFIRVTVSYPSLCFRVIHV